MLQRVLTGSLLGAVTGGAISFVLSRKPARAATKVSATEPPESVAPVAGLSKEATEMLQMFEDFQALPEYDRLQAIIGQLEDMSKKPKLQIAQRFEVSKLASQANRCLDAFELKNKKVLPLDLAEDLKLARKFIDDIKFNLFQVSS